tara:strand:+ start:242 stop:1201 length:960 start_codon:yes stop_codon:yes gene_type:complete
MGYLTGISPTLRELVTPTVDVFAAGVGFTAGSSTYIDLSADPGSENNVIVAFDGVYQNHDTYSISGLRLTLNAAIPTGTLKIECRYAQEHPNYTVVADDAITLAKMASGTDGNVISYDASGNPVAIATGNDGQVLTSAGAGAPPVFETLPAAGYEFVSVITASDDATVAFTNMVSGYDYQYRWSNLTPATNDAMFKAELGTSGPSYLTSGYLGTTFEVNSAASVTSYEYTTYMAIGANSNDGTEPDSAAGHWNIFDPAGSGVTKVMGQSIRRNSGHTFYNGLDHWYHDTAASHVAIKFYFSSGNVEAGVFVQYRRKLSA